MRFPFRRRIAGVDTDGSNGRVDAVTDYRGRAGDRGASQARALMAYYTATQQGEAIMPGLIRWGEKSSVGALHRYAGDLGPLQQYVTTAPGWVGNSAKVRASGGLRSGLPSTSGIPGQPPGDMLALLISTTPPNADILHARKG